MHAIVVIIVMTVVMVRLTLEVHQYVMVLARIRHHDSNTCMGKRLPAHAEHYGEGCQDAKHVLSLSQSVCI